MTIKPIKKMIKQSLLVASVLTLAGCGGSSTTTTTSSDDESANTNNNNNVVQYKLRSSVNNDFATFLKQALIKAYATEVAYPIYYTMEDGAVSQSASGGVTSGAISSTNIQEQGVNEADIIKTDYPYVYQVDKQNAAIKSLQYNTNTQALEPLTKQSMTLTEGHSLDSLYLNNTGSSKDLIAISKANYRIYADWFAPTINWNNDTTALHWLDASDSSQLTHRYAINLEGGLISSRQVGSTLYMVMRHSPVPEGVVWPTSEAEMSANRTLIDNTSIDSLMPALTINGRKEVIASSGCYVPDYADNVQQSTQLVYAVAIDLNNPLATPKSQCLAGNIEAVYASPQAMYLSTTQYDYGTGAAINDVVTGGFVSYASSTISTDIHKFTLSEGDIAYKGSGSVIGHLGWEQDKKSFRMSEHNGELRVITYVGENRSDTSSSPARLHILKEQADGDLAVVGQLPNETRSEPLGKPGEHIYSTRFLGDKAYLVTFRSVDPLYVLDLSNSADPKITGELNITGYSDYLHPINDQLLLGVGKEAIVAEGDGDWNGAWYQGVKIALFDVSNPANPLEIDKVVIGKRGSQTAVTQDHHAFTSLVTGETSLRFAIPVREHNSDAVQSHPSEQAKWSSDNLLVYDVDYSINPKLILNTGLSRKVVNESSQSNQDDRGLFINDKAYYLLGGSEWH